MCPLIRHHHITSTRGINVRVVPDTGATMTLIPWSMVKQLDLAMDEEDNQYNLYTANGEPMTLLGSVILCIETENSNRRELYALVTRQLGKEEILLGSVSGTFPIGSRDENEDSSEEGESHPK